MEFGIQFFPDVGSSIDRALAVGLAREPRRALGAPSTSHRRDWPSSPAPGQWANGLTPGGGLRFYGSGGGEHAKLAAYLRPVRDIRPR